LDPESRRFVGVVKLAVPDKRVDDRQLVVNIRNILRRSPNRRQLIFFDR